MRRTLRKSLHFLFFFLLCFQAGALAQESASSVESRDLTSWIPEVERRFQVKFSYADQDLEGIRVRWDPSGNLEAFLAELKGQTGLSVEKLSDRYYSLSLPETIDVCGRILDNFRETVTGASIEVLGGNQATVSSSNGEFNLGEVPRKAILKISHLGFKGCSAIGHHPLQ